MHHTARTRLFTPCKSNGAPLPKNLESVRITEGKYVDDEEVFKRLDNWKDEAVAHLDLGRAWIGSTRFMRRKVERK